MISVCIPVYNRDVSKLVEGLHHQLEQLESPGEIILIDDASDEYFRALNRRIPADMASLTELQENIGRARIRNLFSGHAKQSHLLFLDCDTSLLSDHFLSDYIACIREYPDRVICGGSVYGPDRPDRSRLLHWKYGSQRESKSAETRNQDPNLSFMTSNFIIPGKLFTRVRFDERLSRYGHEDSLFGYRLTEMKQTIHHLQNPVLHDGLESNSEFLRKTEESIQNLIIITDLVKHDEKFTRTITLLA